MKITKIAVNAERLWMSQGHSRNMDWVNRACSAMQMYLPIDDGNKEQNHGGKGLLEQATLESELTVLPK